MRESDVYSRYVRTFVMSIDLSDNLEKSLGTQTSFKICSGTKINRVRHRLLDVL